MARFSVDRGQPVKGVPSGLAMSQMTRATRSEPAYVHGSTWNVERSGLRYMSDSSVRTNPSIDEPSNVMCTSSASPNCRSGTSTFLVDPRMSVNWSRMNFTCSRSARSRMRAFESAADVLAIGANYANFSGADPVREGVRQQRRTTEVGMKGFIWKALLPMAGAGLAVAAVTIAVGTTATAQDRGVQRIEPRRLQLDGIGGSIGVNVRDVTAEEGQRAKLSPPQGAYVTRVERDSPAEK